MRDAPVLEMARIEEARTGPQEQMDILERDRKMGITLKTTRAGRMEYANTNHPGHWACQVASDANTLEDELARVRSNMNTLDSEHTIAANGLYQDLEIVKAERDKLREEIARVNSENMRLGAQLAACGTIALGWDTSKILKDGDYGWSRSYANVLDLRERYDEMCGREDEK